MIARKEITYRFRGHGATWGLWARLDASLHTDRDARINSDDLAVVGGLAWLRAPASLAQSVTDQFALAIEKGRTCGWAVGGQEPWLVEVHRYTTTPTDSDENTPALAMFEFLRQLLGLAAVEPVVSYDRNAGTYCVSWRSVPKTHEP